MIVQGQMSDGGYSPVEITIVDEVEEHE